MALTSKLKSAIAKVGGGLFHTSVPAGARPVPGKVNGGHISETYPMYSRKLSLPVKPARPY